ncbi:MAG TPA: hypothetical protein VEA69_05245 [Tepidisphaeraceae bacterium]|nr:hypothetical protein [Tepidisphaeraceae bacterium]
MPTPSRIGAVAAVLTLCALAGCNNRTYQVTVVNQTSSPITVGIVKDRPPYEEQLVPVELLALETPLASLPPWGFVVPPGRTADTRPVTGKFPAGTEAYLRVYRGTGTNAELIAVSSPSPHRLDVMLFGKAKNEIVIKDNQMKLDYERISPKVR